MQAEALWPLVGTAKSSSVLTRKTTAAAGEGAILTPAIPLLYDPKSCQKDRGVSGAQ